MLRAELEAIKQAIINEVEGYEFYKLAANQADNANSKEAFLTLANEELMHAEYLKELFEKIKNANGDDFTLAFLVNPPSPNIYKWEKVKDGYTSLAMSVFGIGIQLEKDSIKFYEEAKNNSSYSEAKKLYDLLIKWEKVHLEQFLAEYNKYKEDWWTQQSFAPF
ncbi:ferritin-like domain-containing protein [Alkaliphilus serpentinus]|uniref:Ferritin family protein n=1 Tax=Alkaliphilus serpentinus TaxID=1482731 RepID=A0A833HR82_9FIRM|nr:ferritin family protein [Alkaliphilus serpentinus]KAB3532822.1 ferritin family protein [Alkaliphilus serpentinus]